MKGGRKQNVHVDRVRPLLEREEADGESVEWNPPLLQENSPDDSVEALEGNEPSEISGNSPNNSEQHCLQLDKWPCSQTCGLLWLWRTELNKCIHRHYL